MVTFPILVGKYFNSDRLKEANYINIHILYVHIHLFLNLTLQFTIFEYVWTISIRVPRVCSWTKNTGTKMPTKENAPRAARVYAAINI